MNQIRKTTPVQVARHPQYPEYMVVRTEALTEWAQQQRQPQPWRNPTDLANEQANSNHKRLILSCLGVAAVLAGCSLFVDAVTPDPPAPVPIIRVVPPPTPTPAPAGNNQDCIENCYSIF